MLAQPVSSAYLAGVPSAARCQTISPPGSCRSSTKPIARCTTGHIWARNAVSPVSWYSCQVPTAT